MHRLLLLVALVAVPSRALPPKKAQAMVAAARRALGLPYDFGGRLRGSEGIDCLGLVFLAAEGIDRCSWKSYSYNPSVLVRERQLGAQVLGPLRSADLDVSLLEVGDVVMLVDFIENPREPAVGAIGGRPVWVWHTGVFSGAGHWIVADHFAGQVVETSLVEYLRVHADTYAGLVVTRMSEGPLPPRCRSGRLTLPQGRARALKAK